MARLSAYPSLPKVLKTAIPPTYWREWAVNKAKATFSAGPCRRQNSKRSFCSLEAVNQNS